MRAKRLQKQPTIMVGWVKSHENDRFQERITEIHTACLADMRISGEGKG